MIDDFDHADGFQLGVNQCHEFFPRRAAGVSGARGVSLIEPDLDLRGRNHRRAIDGDELRRDDLLGSIGSGKAGEAQAERDARYPSRTAKIGHFRCSFVARSGLVLWARLKEINPPRTADLTPFPAS